MTAFFRRFWVLLAFWLAETGSASAYGLLTHEALIDANWETTLAPAIRKRFPAVTDSSLQACHAFAYGGAIIPDMGYFPMGSHLFSDLLHYVRTGDFAEALIRDARSESDYAFALGVLAHYNADRYGHPIGVNPSVPLLFPKKADGRTSMTYEENPTAHSRTEFGFDVLQVARGNYASEAYQHFISFEVADDLLKRAFEETYGLSVDSIFKNYDRSVRTFRWTVRDVVPQLTRNAWRSRRHQIRTQYPSATARQFHYRMRRAVFRKAYGEDYDRPGFGARLVAGLLHALPKVGPLRPLKPVIPNEAAEALFVRSFDSVARHYRQAVADDGVQLRNIDWDTGAPTGNGEYGLADTAYNTLLRRLHDRQWEGTSLPLRLHLLAYYNRSRPAGEAAAPPADVLVALDDLRRHTDAH